MADEAGRNLLANSGLTAEGIERTDILVRAIFPEPPTVSVPATVPAEAAELFLEAKHDFRAGRNPAGIIAHCRSVMDVCLVNLKAEGDGRKARIANLLTKGVLTPSLAEWAATLWDDGNTAVHEIKGDRHVAAQHVAYLELLFEVAYALPEQIAAGRAQPPNVEQEVGG